MKKAARNKDDALFAEQDRQFALEFPLSGQLHEVLLPDFQRRTRFWCKKAKLGAMVHVEITGLGIFEVMYSGNGTIRTAEDLLAMSKNRSPANNITKRTILG